MTKKYIVYLENMNTKERIDIADNCATEEEANKAMVEYLNKLGIKPSYYRCALMDNGKTTGIDYGSWSSFIYIKEVNL